MFILCNGAISRPRTWGRCHGRFDIRLIKYQKNRGARVAGRVPRTIGSLRIPNPPKYLGRDECLFGLDRFLPGFDLLHVTEQSFYSTYQIAARKHLGRLALERVQSRFRRKHITALISNAYREVLALPRTEPG
jgi:hypothetical protein